jgi:hypothetical protein
MPLLFYYRMCYCNTGAFVLIVTIMAIVKSQDTLDKDNQHADSFCFQALDVIQHATYTASTTKQRKSIFE